MATYFLATGVPYKVETANESLDQLSMGKDDSQASMEFRFKFSDVFSNSSKIIDNILGYSYRVAPGGGTPYIFRVPPLQHPYKSFLRATRITAAKGVQLNGQTKPLAASTGSISFPTYTDVLITVAFATLPYEIGDNSYSALGKAPGGVEWQRYCVWTDKDSSRFLQRKSGVFKFSSSPSVPLAYRNSSFARPQLKKEVHTAINVTWHQVPRDAAYGPPPAAPNQNDINRTLNANIRNSYGTINRQTFAGFPINTLLHSAGAEVTPWMAPVEAARLGLPASSVPRMVDIKFTLDFFDPVRAPLYTEARGHQLFPSPSDPFYYLATGNLSTLNATLLAGNPRAARLYQESVFSNIFAIA